MKILKRGNREYICLYQVPIVHIECNYCGAEIEAQKCEIENMELFGVKCPDCGKHHSDYIVTDAGNQYLKYEQIQKLSVNYRTKVFEKSGKCHACEHERNGLCDKLIKDWENGGDSHNCNENN